MNAELSPLERTLLSLCEIPSPTGEEGPLCDYVEELCVTTLGRASVKRDGHSLVVSPGVSPGVGRHEKPSVVLAGHLDVVRTVHEGPPRVEHERLYGPGAADMKSGLAVMLHLIQEIPLGTSTEFTPTFVFYEREEGPYLENRLGDLLCAFPKLSRAELAVCLEPSSNALQLGCMGSLHARVKFTGRTAHSARPWQGENAIYKSVGLLSRLSALSPRDLTMDGLLYREVISATLAEGGIGRNVVPDGFTLNLNMRFAPDRTVDEAVAVLEALVGSEAETSVFDRSPAARPFRENSWVKRLESLGVAGVEPKQAWTDVARFAEAGVAAVNLGPGTQSQAHQKNEWTDRGALAEGMKLFQRWVFGPRSE